MTQHYPNRSKMDKHEISEFPLPQVRSSLEPFIRTRQEALHIRRCLSAYLQSQLEVPGGTHLYLPAPSTEVVVNDIPAELSGLRRQYLKAVKANSRARKEFQSLTHMGNALPLTDDYGAPTRDVSGRGEPHITPPLEPYLGLQRQRQKYEKLQIMKDYLDSILSKPPSRSDYLDIDQMLGEMQLPPEPSEALPDKSGENNSARLSGVDELVTRLQRAVLQAKHSVENEKQLLAESEARRRKDRGSQAGIEPINPTARLQALTLTRDELIDWIEGELVETGDVVESEQAEQTPENHLGGIENLIEAIRHHYGDYLKVRRQAVTVTPHAGSTALIKRPVAVRHVASNEEKGARLRKTPSQTNIISSLLSHHLIPTSRTQKSIALQRSHLAASVASIQQYMMQSLDRLADESHLLPAYPLLAGNSRFKHAAATVASRASDRAILLGGETYRAGQDQCRRKVLAWAFAAGAASAATREQLDGHLKRGSRQVDGAQELLAELSIILNNDGKNELTESTSDGDEEDIWAGSAQGKIKVGERGHRRKPRKPKANSKPQGHGPWKGLNGYIGVIRKDR
ncbi:MAG: hypothetical protein M1837_004533 [Sclerophora amabilis]|nr:MAG: hypothetical protein M1837_004533 [Sclerophora amabilis]